MWCFAARGMARQYREALTSGKNRKMLIDQRTLGNSRKDTSRVFPGVHMKKGVADRKRLDYIEELAAIIGQSRSLVRLHSTYPTSSICSR